MTDWNPKWDWDSSDMLNSSAIGIPKGGAARWGADEETEMGSFYPFGGGGCVNNSGSCSDMGSGLLIMGSASGYLDPSFKGDESKTLHFDGHSSDGFSKKQEGMGTSTSVCSPIVSGETMLGLKLGKRTYFEDVCAASSGRTSPFSVIPEVSERVGRKKLSSNSPEVPRCQVQGCSMDLSSAKEYHRKHRVCETHTKCPKVIVAGQERRFCQQCSRFHSLFEFDEKKRSCRKRLSDHNARRRKPQSETMQFNATRLVPSLYGGRQHAGLIFNGFPPAGGGTTASNITWENGLGADLIQTKELLNPLDDQQHHINGTTPHHPPPSMLSPGDPDKFFSSSKGAAALSAFTQGCGEYVGSPGLVTAQDRACSLLSPNTWGPPCETSHATSLVGAAPPDHGGTPVQWGTMLPGASRQQANGLKDQYHHLHHHHHHQGMDSGGGNEGQLPFHLFGCGPHSHSGILCSRRHPADD